MEGFCAIFVIISFTVLTEAKSSDTDNLVSFHYHAPNPSTGIIELGTGENIELILVPAGRFLMGESPPPPIDETVLYKEILWGQEVCAIGSGFLIIFVAFSLAQNIRARARPQYSLLFLIIVVMTAGSALLGGLHWRTFQQKLEKSRVEYFDAKTRFDEEHLDDEPAHEVTLTAPFYISRHLITQAQYIKVMGKNPSGFKTNGSEPVEQVSWEDAIHFTKKLSRYIGREIRLPTEAQWEYACYDKVECNKEFELSRIAWYKMNSDNKTHGVGLKQANSRGLFDMRGNVEEWCIDKFGPYSLDPVDDPAGPLIGTDRVTRGGSWSSDANFCSCTSRFPADPKTKSITIGFRIIMLSQ